LKMEKKKYLALLPGGQIFWEKKMNMERTEKIKKKGE